MKVAGEVLRAKQAPHRPGTAPALGLRAERAAVILSQTRPAKETTMWTRALLNWLKSRRSVAGVRRPSRRPNVRLGLEALEDRCVPAVLPVTSTLDDAAHPGTLRYAIAHADDGDTI